MAGNYNFKEETGEMQFDAQGNLKVNIQTGAGSGGTSATDDAAFTAGSGSGTPMMGFVTADTVDSGDVGVVGMLANRQLKVTLYDSAGAELSVGGGTQYTEDAASAANPVGTVSMMVRQDTPASEVTTNGDNIAQRATQYGAAYTQIVSSTGTFIDTFGGGTQYTEGDTDATITGTALMMEGAANTLVAAPGTTADGLLVNLGTNNDVTVTGTVTANLAAGTNNIGDVDVLSVPAPLNLTGGGVEASALRVTIANDSTGVLSIDDNGGSITVDGSVTVSATNLDIRDLVAASDAVSVHGDVGIIDQLDLVNSNPAVVAIVDANGDQITSFGGGTQYTEDAAAAANPVGTVPILIRQDTPASEVSTNGDNIAQRATAYGAAYTQIVSSSGAFIDTFGGGTQYTEGDTDATITGTAMLMEGAANALVVAQGTAADGLLVNLGANNDITVTGTVAVTQSGTWDEVGINDSGNSITVDDGGSSLTIDGTVTANAGTGFPPVVTDGAAAGTTGIHVLGTDGTNAQILSTNATGHVNIADGGNSITVDGTVTADTELPTAAALADNTANPTVPAVGSFGMVWDGATWDRQSGTSADGTLVNLGTNNDVTVTGTVTEANSAAALTALQLIDNAVSGTGFNISQVNGEAVDVGAGTEAAAIRVTLPTNGTGILAGVTTVTTLTGTTTLTPGTGATNLGKAIDSVGGATDTGVAVLAIRDDALATLTPVDGDYVATRTNARGANWVAIEDGAGGQITSFGGGTQYTEDVAAAADPVGTAQILVRADTPGTITTTNGDNVARRGTNYGAAYSQIVTSAGAYVDTFGGGTEVAEDTAHSTGVLGGVTMAVRRDTPTALAGTDNDYIPLTTDANGGAWVSLATKLDATNDTVGVGGQTTGGHTTYHLVSAASTNATNIKASAGQLYGWYIYNSNAAARKVAFHNTAGTPTAGASVFFSLVIPPSSGANVFSTIGIAFSTGIAITTVTGLADSDSAAVALNDLVINLFYK